MNDLITNVNQVKSDFNSIKQAIINKGINVPIGTPTSQYGELINNISGGGEKLNIKLGGLVEHTTGSPGWKIGVNGSSTSKNASEYCITYYKVAEGLSLYVKAEDDNNECKFIWSKSERADVTSNYPNSSLIGTPVTDVVNGIVTVPKGATYICFSQRTDDTETGVYKLCGEIEILLEEVEVEDVSEERQETASI